MKKKSGLILAGVGILIFIIFGSSMLGKGEAEKEDYESAYYVEAKGNLILMLAKMIDKSCYYVVDIVVSGVGSVFNSILGN